MMNDNAALLRLALETMDLTSLGEADTEADIRALCRRADTPNGHPAAVCVYPAFVVAARRELARQGLAKHVRVATVVNFPAGDGGPEAAAAGVCEGLALGADELDVVFPWRAFLQGDEAAGRELVAASREACGGAVLKIILETGELAHPERIRRAAELAVEGGADFLKTSTGKVPVNATPEAARVLLELIREAGGEVGCKVSGGIRGADDALAYLDLAAEIMGPDWVSPARFRIGASGLLDDLLRRLEAGPR